MTTTATNEEAQIRECLATLARALRAKDVDALMAGYAPDVVTFDIAPPLQVQGVGYRKNFEKWFASVEGTIDYEMQNAHISVGGNIAICRYLAHVKSTRRNGEKADYWVRVTSAFEKLDGAWKIVHEHVSLPVEMPSLRAVLDAKPPS